MCAHSHKLCPIKAASLIPSLSLHAPKKTLPSFFFLCAQRSPGDEAIKLPCKLQLSTEIASLPTGPPSLFHLTAVISFSMAANWSGYTTCMHMHCIIVIILRKNSPFIPAFPTVFQFTLAIKSLETHSRNCSRVCGTGRKPLNVSSCFLS